MHDHDYCEYAVEKKKEGAFLFKIIAVGMLGIALTAGVFFIVMPRWTVVGLACLAVLCIVAWYLSRYFYIEYEYSQTGGYIDFAAIYSKQFRKERLSVDLKESARCVAPYDGKFKGFKVQGVLDMRSSSKSPDSYMLIFDNGNGQYAVLFDATKRLIKNIYNQIPSMVTMSDKLP